MRIPDISPPSQKIKNYAEWGVVLMIAAGVVTLCISVPFWVVGKQSPVPVVAEPPPKEKKNSIPHFHFDIGEDGNLKVERREIKSESGPSL